ASSVSRPSGKVNKRGRSRSRTRTRRRTRGTPARCAHLAAFSVRARATPPPTTPSPRSTIPTSERPPMVSRRLLDAANGVLDLLLDCIRGGSISDGDVAVVYGFGNGRDLCRKLGLKLRLESRCFCHIPVLALRNVRPLQFFLETFVKISGVRSDAQESRYLGFDLIVCCRLPFLLSKTKDNRFF